jgi:hypothetical protein
MDEKLSQKPPTVKVTTAALPPQDHGGANGEGLEIEVGEPTGNQTMDSIPQGAIHASLYCQHI